MEAEKGAQRPKFKHHYQFELDWESGQLHFGMQHSLAADWLIFILESSFSSIPNAKNDVQRTE